jgi:hypothetical protein
VTERQLPPRTNLRQTTKRVNRVQVFLRIYYLNLLGEFLPLK